MADDIALSSWWMRNILQNYQIKAHISHNASQLDKSEYDMKLAILDRTQIAEKRGCGYQRQQGANAFASELIQGIVSEFAVKRHFFDTKNIIPSYPKFNLLANVVP